MIFQKYFFFRYFNNRSYKIDDIRKKFDKDITFEEWTEAIQNYNDEFDLQSTPYRLLNLYEELRRMNDPKFKVGGHTFCG